MAEFVPMVVAAISGAFCLGSMVSLFNSWGV